MSNVSSIYNGFIGRTGANIRKYFEMTVNDVLKNTGFRFKILNRYALNKKYNGITILNHLKEIVPWVMPENKLLPMAFCMYTTDDYENNKWSEPLTMILIGTTNILLKQSVKNCIQIMFSFNNKKKIKQLSNVPKYKNKSMNYNLMLCLLAWAKLDNNIDYVTIEAVSWASQRQSEKLGFELDRLDDQNRLYFKGIPSRGQREIRVDLLNIIGSLLPDNDFIKNIN